MPGLTSGRCARRVPSDAVHDRVRGLCVAGVTSLDRNAWAIERRHAGHEAPALGSGRGQEAGECGHPIGIAGLQGPTEGVIVERCGHHTGRHQSRGGLLLAPPGDEVERVMHTPQAMAYPRLDRFTHGEVPHGRVLWRGLIDDAAQAECVEPAATRPRWSKTGLR
jgi:hypothetical protein